MLATEFALIALLAVGSDYNLMLVSRIEEEIGAGLKTGLIRGMGVTGPVVTAAGVVFAVTMGTMITSDLRAIGQFGTTIGICLLFDTFVVRSLITPSIMTVMGRWFWWPKRVRVRPASQMLRSSGRARWFVRCCTSRGTRCRRIRRRSTRCSTRPSIVEMRRQGFEPGDNRCALPPPRVIVE